MAPPGETQPHGCRCPGLAQRSSRSASYAEFLHGLAKLLDELCARQLAQVLYDVAVLAAVRVLFETGELAGKGLVVGDDLGPLEILPPR